MVAKRLIINKLTAVVLLLVLVSSGCSMVQSAQALYTSGDTFMRGLQEGNYAQAYTLCVPEMQQKIGDVASLQKMIEDNQAQPKDWLFTSFNVKMEKDQTTAKLEGNVTYQDDRKGAVTLEMLKMGDDWKLTSFNLTW